MFPTANFYCKIPLIFLKQLIMNGINVTNFRWKNLILWVCQTFVFKKLLVKLIANVFQMKRPLHCKTNAAWVEARKENILSALNICGLRSSAGFNFFFIAISRQHLHNYDTEFNYKVSLVVQVFIFNLSCTVSTDSLYGPPYRLFSSIFFGGLLLEAIYYSISTIR